MARPEVLRVLEEADLLITAAVAGKWSLPRIETEWRNFVANVERRHEPAKFRNNAAFVVYTVREIKDLDDAKPDTGQTGQQGSNAAPSVQ